MKVAFLTLGCKVNYYETEKMAEQFRDRGFVVTDFGEKADIYVINTCTVTNVADRKSRQMIHRAKKKNPESIVVAVGCYVESGGEKLNGDPAIDAAFSNKEKMFVAEQVIKRFGLQERIKNEIAGGNNFCHGVFEGERKKVGAGSERTRAYLKIQDGCNQFCSYCTIPYVRGGGRLGSTPPEEAAEQVGRLAEQGYKEVVLTGIHLSSYGVDRFRGGDFVKLQGKPLLEVITLASGAEGIERIRLGSLEPRIISEKFLQELAGIPKICPHFHLSLQSGSDSVLRRMNRHYTTVEYRDKVELIRKYFDCPAITTDVIVGFPGETDGEFEETRKYLAGIGFADIHVFRYSPRRGTRAAAMEGQIRPEVKNQRSEILLADTRTYRTAYGNQFLGRREKVLFEETVVEEGEWYLAGYNERYVRIGVSRQEAEKCGYCENEIYEVPVHKILFKQNS